MRVSEVMAHPAICCSRTTSIRNAVRIMHDSDIGMLLVVEEQWGRGLMGVVTDRDLCLGGLGEEHDATLTTVEDCMTTEVITVTPDTDIRVVAAMMAEHHIRRIPIVDRDKKVVGIVGIADLIAHQAIDAEEVWHLLGSIMGVEHPAHYQAA